MNRLEFSPELVGNPFVQVELQMLELVALHRWVGQFEQGRLAAVLASVMVVVAMAGQRKQAQQF